jgi:hypothetical protein
LCGEVPKAKELASVRIFTLPGVGILTIARLSSITVRQTDLTLEESQVYGRGLKFLAPFMYDTQLE